MLLTLCNTLTLQSIYTTCQIIDSDSLLLNNPTIIIIKFITMNLSPFFVNVRGYYFLLYLFRSISNDHLEFSTMLLTSAGGLWHACITQLQISKYHWTICILLEISPKIFLRDNSLVTEIRNPRWTQNNIFSGFWLQTNELLSPIFFFLFNRYPYF